MSNSLELALLLKLNDQMSVGLKSAMKSVQQESNNVAKSMNGVANATNRIKPTAIERVTAALRSMQGAAKASISMLQKVGQAGAAAAAGGYVLKSAAERPMAYDRRLAIMANTAYSDRDVAGRIAGKSKMDAAIRGAVKQGGGTPEQAAETLNELIGSGAMGNGQAGINSSLGLLPTLQKYATGTGADPQDLAKIVIAAKQSMGITDAQIPAMLSKAIKGGQEGGFELKDMAKWLPQEMALAGGQGMKGMKGFETLVSANQVSRITAGTADEAGNNLVNLLAKINSTDTSNDFKKVGIDLSGSLAAARAKGMNPLDAFVGLVGTVGEKDKKYMALRAKSEKQTGTEQGDTYGAMADLMMAKGIGKTVQDRQALMALIAMIQQKDKYGQIKKAVTSENGKEGETSFGTVANSLDYKAEQVGNKKAFAAMDTLGALEKPLGFLLDGVNKGAEAFPGFTAALYAATIAVGALTAAAGMGRLLSGPKPAGVPGIPGEPGGTPGVAKALPKLRGGISVAVAAIVAYSAYQANEEYQRLSKLQEQQRKDDAARKARRAGIDKQLHAFGGDTLVNATRGYDFQQLQQVLSGLEQVLKKPQTINLHIDGKQVTTVVNDNNQRKANRH